MFFLSIYGFLVTTVSQYLLFVYETDAFLETILNTQLFLFFLANFVSNVKV